MKMTRRGPYSFALGASTDSLTYQRMEPLLFETETLVKGLGLAANRTDMISGSSGAFLAAWT
jgi:hypothetical protein